jgi:hypothetical protein
MRGTYQPGPPPTLAHVLRQGDTVTARCQRHACGHAAELDVAALAERLGLDCTVPAMRARLSCAKCGGREVGLTLSPRLTGGFGDESSQARGWLARRNPAISVARK